MVGKRASQAALLRDVQHFLTCHGGAAQVAALRTQYERSAFQLSTTNEVCRKGALSNHLGYLRIQPW